MRVLCIQRVPAFLSDNIQRCTSYLPLLDFSINYKQNTETACVHLTNFIYSE